MYRHTELGGLVTQSQGRAEQKLLFRAGRCLSSVDFSFVLNCLSTSKYFHGHQS